MSVKRSVTFGALLVALSLLSRAELLAQNGPALIRQGIGAYNDFDPQRALWMLRRGLDPAAGPRDSLWALGVQYLAQILHEQGDETAARSWIRWAVRFVPNLRLDTLNLLTDVIVEFRRARLETTGAQDAGVTAQWVWPPDDPGSGPGRLEVRASDPLIGLQVTVAGQGVVGLRATLPAGTYEIEARAPAHRPVRVAREVLPGITTILTVTLEPAGLTGETRRRVRERIVAIESGRFGSTEPGCAAAVRVEGDGLWLTTYRAIRGADRIAIARGTMRADSTVASYDVARDLVVLKVSGIAPGPLAMASSAVDSQAAWGFGLAGCDSVTDARVAVASRGAGTAVFGLRGVIPAVVTGSPLVDSTGGLLALVRDDSTVIAAGAAADLIAAARVNVAARRLQTLAEVAGAEHHRFGVVTVTAPPGVAATATVTPREPWHWPELATHGELPLRFAGPEGRYRVVVTANQRTVYDSVLVVVPGVGGGLQVPVRPVATRRKGRFPWAIAVLGVVGAGTAAVLLLGGDEPPTTGSISISVPNP